MDHLFLQRLADHLKAIESARALEPRVRQAAGLIIEAVRAGGGVWLFGNGGSAADAQHIAGELVGRFLKNRPAIRAAALNADASVMTCLANDFSYESIFARQLEALARPGDVAVGLSTSGRSENVLAGLDWAREHDVRTLAITGPDPGPAGERAELVLPIPGDSTARVQEVGMVVYHVLCEIVEAELFGEA